MSVLLVGAGTAAWLGILTSISPCPLATNIAAVSFIGRHLRHARLIILAGIAYTLGRTLTYTLLGALIVGGLCSIPGAAEFLQQVFARALGPLLILVGLVLLGVIPLPSFSFIRRRRMEQSHPPRGWATAFPLGIVFALSFCPVSAALFFGSLVPLAVRDTSLLLYPLLFGIGTALPVLVLALPMGLGARWVGTAFSRLSVFERWARHVTAVVFIAVGFYEVIRYWW